MVFVMPVGDGQQGHSATAEGDESLSVCDHFKVTLCSLHTHSAPALQPLCSHSTSDPTEKGNGSSALYLIIYSLFRRISASIAKTIVLTILRFLDFAFAR